MNTADNILFLLKTRGPQTAQQLAERLALTSMGARRQLEAAVDKGLVDYEDVADKVGRPSPAMPVSPTATPISRCK
jgi:predicted ArsR family transcriptional regulator